MSTLQTVRLGVEALGEHLDLPDLPDVEVADYYTRLDENPEAYVVNGPAYTAFLAIILIILPVLDQFTNLAFLIFLIRKFEWFQHKTGKPIAPLELETTLVFYACLSVVAQIADVVGTWWVYKEYMEDSSYAKYEQPLTFKKGYKVLAGFVAFLNYQFLDLYKCTGMRFLRIIVTTLGAVPQLYATISYTYNIAQPNGFTDGIPIASMLLSFYSILNLYSFELVWWVGRLFISINWHSHQIKFWVVSTITSVIMFLYGYGVYWADLPAKGHHSPPPPPKAHSSNASGGVHSLMGMYLFF